MFTDKIHTILVSPITALVVALGLSAVASSGRLSMNLANIFLVLAFIAGCFGIFNTGQPIHFRIIFCFSLGIGLTLVSLWLQPNTQPVAEIKIGRESHTPVPLKNEHQKQGKQEVNIITPSPQIVMQLPPVGNLKQRTISLSDEIMEDLYSRGWQKNKFTPQQNNAAQSYSNNPKDMEVLSKRCAFYFKSKFYERVLNIRKEFSQLGYRDQQLDDFFKYQGIDYRLDEFVILPQQIKEVAERLKALAEQI